MWLPRAFGYARLKQAEVWFRFQAQVWLPRMRAEWLLYGARSYWTRLAAFGQVSYARLCSVDLSSLMVQIQTTLVVA